MQNAYVELSKVDEEEENPAVIRQVNNACQFVYRNLEKRKYQVKVLEKQGKLSPNPKLLFEQVVDLSDEREINNGLRTLKAEIGNLKRISVDSLNYSIFSAIFLCLAVMSLFKFDLTVWLFNKLIAAPFASLRKLFKSKRR